MSSPEHNPPESYELFGPATKDGYIIAPWYLRTAVLPRVKDMETHKPRFVAPATIILDENAGSIMIDTNDKLPDENAIADITTQPAVMHVMRKGSYMRPKGLYVVDMRHVTAPLILDRSLEEGTDSDAHRQAMQKHGTMPASWLISKNPETGEVKHHSNTDDLEREAYAMMELVDIMIVENGIRRYFNRLRRDTSNDIIR